MVFCPISTIQLMTGLSGNLADPPCTPTGDSIEKPVLQSQKDDRLESPSYAANRTKNFFG
jgi:hypothetical protein